MAPPRSTVERGDRMVGVGCSNGQDPTVLETRVTSLDRYQGPPNIEASGRRPSAAAAVDCLTARTNWSVSATTPIRKATKAFTPGSNRFTISWIASASRKSTRSRVAPAKYTNGLWNRFAQRAAIIRGQEPRDAAPDGFDRHRCLVHRPQVDKPSRPRAHFQARPNKRP